MKRAILLVAFFVASGAEVAYVDLAGSPKTLQTGLVSVYVRGSGVGDRKVDPRTPLLSVKVNGVVPYTDPVTGGTGQAIEVTVTNSGKTEMSLPIGKDPVPLLAPSDPMGDRRHLDFVIFIGDGQGQNFVPAAESASNSNSPGSIAHLAPGDYVTFRLPFNTYRADLAWKSGGYAPIQLSVHVTLSQIVIEQGHEVHDHVGGVIASENSIPWPQ